MSVLHRARWLIILIFTALASIALWLRLSPVDKRASGDEGAAALDEPPEQTSIPAGATNATPARPLPARPQQSATAPKVREVVGPGPEAPHEPGMLPHPMDEAHARIQAENDLIQALNDAMSFRNVKAMREMLVEYRKLDPSDVHSHQAGYEVIADCIEFPGEASLVAAREFYDTERHSSLRRFVRRICFENSY